jgi:hypothetical protein
MQRLLRAKYDAGMLKPFNYVKGYARLFVYMDSHMCAAWKQKILARTIFETGIIALHSLFQCDNFAIVPNRYQSTCGWRYDFLVSQLV